MTGPADDKGPVGDQCWTYSGRANVCERKGEPGHVCAPSEADADGFFDPVMVTLERTDLAFFLTCVPQWKAKWERAVTDHATHNAITWRDLAARQVEMFDLMAARIEAALAARGSSDGE